MSSLSLDVLAPAAPCPAASVCAAEPDSCQAHLSPASIALLVLLTTAPLLSIAWLPVAGAAEQLRWGAPSVNRVGDAMGVSSGLLIVLASLAMGFLPTFYLLLASPRPCATALGGCGSISCACGNYYPQGYTWMCVTLLVGALLALREAALLDGYSRVASAVGAIMVLFTAIFPERFTLDPTSPGTMLYAGYLMHLFGLGSCMVLLVATPFLRVCAATHRMPRRARLRALLPRAIHVTALLAYGVSFIILRPPEPDISDFCAPITPALFEGGGEDPHLMAAAACAAWPSLPPASCATLASVGGTPGAPVPTRYTCAFVNSSLTQAEALLLPPAYALGHDGACQKARCRLLVNARSMSLEFGMLFLVGAYITSFLRVDLAWVASVSGGRAAFNQPTDGEQLVRSAYVAPTPDGPPWSMPHGVRATQ